MDILKKLQDLEKQAKTEKSHYYTAATIKEAIQEIRDLRKVIQLQAKILLVWDL